MSVFDSSAILALLQNEIGADFGEGPVDDADDKAIHAVNMCEIYYKLLRIHDTAIAEQAVSDLHALGIVEYSNLDGAFW